MNVQENRYSETQRSNVRSVRMCWVSLNIFRIQSTGKGRFYWHNGGTPLITFYPTCYLTGYRRLNTSYQGKVYLFTPAECYCFAVKIKTWQLRLFTDSHQTLVLSPDGLPTLQKELSQIPMYLPNRSARHCQTAPLPFHRSTTVPTTLHP